MGSNFLRMVMLCASASAMAGCFSARIDAYACTKDYGLDIKTRYRYRLEKVSKKDFLSGGLSAVMSLEDYCADFYRKVDLCKALQEHQPNVFSSKGVPVIVNEVSRDADHPFVNDLAFNLCLRLGFIVPVRDYLSSKITFAVKVAKSNDIVKTVDIGWYGKWGVSLIMPPTWILDDTPEERPAGAGYYVSETVKNKSWAFHGMLTDSPYWNVDKALAYAVASKLKEMEESGEMDAILSGGDACSQANAITDERKCP